MCGFVVIEGISPLVLSANPVYIYIYIYIYKQDLY